MANITYARTLDGKKIYAERAVRDENGKKISTTYAKLTDVPAAQVNSDWNESNSSSKSFILNKPNVKPLIQGADIDITENANAVIISYTGGHTVVSDGTTITGDGSANSPLAVANPGITSVATDGTTISGDGVNTPLSVTNPGITSVATDGTTITGDGVNTPLSVDTHGIETEITEEVEEAVETLKSRIMYTMAPASVTGQVQYQAQSNQPYCFLTLFSPNMDMPLSTDTLACFCLKTGLNSGAVTSDTYLYLVIFEINYSSKTFRWIANTDNIVASLMTPGLKHPHLIDIETDQLGNNETFKSSKLYFVGILTNYSNSLQAIGNGNYSQLNFLPSMVFHCQSNFHGSSLMTHGDIKTYDGIHSINSSSGSEDIAPLFMAFTNIQISEIVIVATEPFVIFTGYEYDPTTLSALVPSSTSFTDALQCIKTTRACTLNSWAIIDTNPSPTNRYVGKIIRDVPMSGGNWDVHEDNDPDNPTGTLVTEALTGNLAGYYKHTYTPSSPVQLANDVYYQFPVTSSISNDRSDTVMQYKAGVYRKISFWDGITQHSYPDSLGVYLEVAGTYVNDNSQTISFSGVI